MSQELKVSGNVLKCKTASQTEYNGDGCRQGKFSSWFFFFPPFSILSDLGTKLHKRQDSRNPALRDGRRRCGFYFRAGTEGRLLQDSAHGEAVGEGNRSRRIMSLGSSMKSGEPCVPLGGGESAAHGGLVSGAAESLGANAGGKFRPMCGWV